MSTARGLSQAGAGPRCQSESEGPEERGRTDGGAPAAAGPGAGGWLATVATVLGPAGRRSPAAAAGPGLRRSRPRRRLTRPAASAGDGLGRGEGLSDPRGGERGWPGAAAWGSAQRG